MAPARPKTLIQRVDFPVYDLDFTVDDDLVAVGGGGANRSGVKNKVRVLRYSRSGRYMVSGFTDGKVTLLNYPDLTPVFPPIRFNDIQDADFDFEEKHVAVATPKAIIILSLEDGAIEQVLNSPNLNRNTACEFRACRYWRARGESQMLYAVVNPISRGRGFICMWKLRPGRQIPTRATMAASVSRKAITSFCVR
ncbi:hypothetical protein EC973_006633 [Apophysomyces ossiformis]|uniref:Uncharacterized protein n=1 Tax=Apophysomyces ossiformis TaxID=679940 RepID=A0A8H7EQY7_9FUNG|nr:hypothetical protein EC973_006633 [Apophysomyces ossiformis]